MNNSRLGQRRGWGRVTAVAEKLPMPPTHGLGGFTHPTLFHALLRLSVQIIILLNSQGAGSLGEPAPPPAPRV